MANCCRSLICKIYCRYRQILDKAIQFTDADQLESLKAFVEASMLSLYFNDLISFFFMTCRVGSETGCLT